MKNKRVAGKKNRWEKKQNRLVPNSGLTGLCMIIRTQVARKINLSHRYHKVRLSLMLCLHLVA